MPRVLLCALFMVLLHLQGNAQAPAPPAPPAPPKADAVAPAPAPASTRQDLIIPELPTADMRLSWSDFRELLRMVQPEKTKETVKAAVKPPVPYVIQNASYEAVADAGGFVRVQAKLSLQVWEENWISIPVLGGEVALNSASCDNEVCFLARKDAWFTLLSQKPGLHELTLDFHVPCAEVEGEASMTFSCAEAMVTRMTLLAPAADAQFRAPGAASIQTEQRAEGSSATLLFKTAQSIEVHWRRPAPPVPVVPETPKEAPRFSATTTTLATVFEDHLSCDTTLTLDVLRGELEGFTLRLPKEANVLKLEGTGVEWQSEEVDGGQAIRARVNHVVTGAFPVTLACEMPIAKEAAAVAVPSLSVDDAARLGGSVGIATGGNVEVEVDDAALDGVKRIDASELPAAVRAQTANPILHAFRIAKSGYLLGMSLRRLEDIPVRVAGIDRVRFVSVLLEDGRLITRASYMVRNHFKKFMRVRLTPQAEVWGAMVGGETVRPARGSESAEYLEVMLPLRQSKESGDSSGAFPVELIFAQPCALAPDLLNRIALEAPRTDIPADWVEWEILAPAERCVYRADGNMKRALRLGPWGDEAAGKGKFVATPGAEESEETLYRMREGIERFLIQDINGPGTSTGASPFDGKQSTSLPEVDIRNRPAGGSAAGILPIRVNLPKTGVPYAFTKTLLPADDACAVTLDMYDTRLLTASNWLLRLVCAVWGVGALALLRRGYARGRVGMRGVALMALALATLLYAGSWVGLDVRAAIVCAVAGGAVVALARWLLRGKRHDTASGE